MLQCKYNIRLPLKISLLKYISPPRFYSGSSKRSRGECYYANRLVPRDLTSRQFSPDWQGWVYLLETEMPPKWRMLTGSSIMWVLICVPPYSHTIKLPFVKSNLVVDQINILPFQICFERDESENSNFFFVNLKWTTQPRLSKSCLMYTDHKTESGHFTNKRRFFSENKKWAVEGRQKIQLLKKRERVKDPRSAPVLKYNIKLCWGLFSFALCIMQRFLQDFLHVCLHGSCIWFISKFLLPALF